MLRKHRGYVLLGSWLLPLLVISLASLTLPAHAASPDLTVNNIWLERDSAPGQPASQIQPGEAFNIVATIKNLGGATAYGYYLDVYYDSEYGRGGPDDIAPGEVQEWYVGPLREQSGTHTTRWVVDPDTQIAELNELNNEKEYAFTIGSSTVTTARTSTSAVTSTSYLSMTTTRTVTSYTGTQTSTSTIVVPVTVTVGPSTSTLSVQTTQVLTLAGTTTATAYVTKTVTSYTGTSTSTSTIVVPVTLTIGQSAMTSTVQTTQFLALTYAATVTSYTTTTSTSYTGTSTSTSTRVVYTTLTKSGAATDASSPLAYFEFLSLLAITAATTTSRTTSTKGTLKALCPRSLEELTESMVGAVSGCLKAEK